MPLDVVGELGLLGSAFIRFAPEEGFVDHPVELVVVHDVQAPLELCVLSLEACYGFRVVPTLVFVALSQGLLHLGEELIVELEPAQCSSELALQDSLRGTGSKEPASRVSDRIVAMELPPMTHLRSGRKHKQGQNQARIRPDALVRQ